MSRPDRAATYAAVLRLPGAPRAFTAATLGRLSYATFSLSLLVSVQRATSSYTAAGAAIAVYAVSSVLMPVKSRLVDRYGQRHVLPALSVGFAGALLAVVAVAVAGTTATAPYVVLSAVAGLAAPPLGPSMRALWAALTPEPALRQRAYSLDGIVEEVLYAVGPLLVGLILTVSSAAAALAATAVLNLAGTIGLATSAVAAEHATAVASPPSSGVLGPLRHRGFALLALAMLGAGIGGGPIEVAILARTQQEGQPGLAGYLIAGLSVGSAAGGLLWGRLRHHRPVSIQLGTLVTVAALGTVAAALAPSFPLLALALVVTGAVSAPAFVVSFVAADDLVGDSGRTEATTWVATAANTGVALGVGGAGAISDRVGPDAALLAGAAVLGVTAVLVLATRARLDAPR